MDFVPPLGGEIQKTRPAVIELKDESHNAMADQIATVNEWRPKSRVGTLGLSDIRATERAMCVQLGLPVVRLRSDGRDLERHFRLRNCRGQRLEALCCVRFRV